MADYMAQCLFHPEHGYYRKPTPFGTQGDFITAPEVSQMFGELTAIWIIDVWQKMGHPAPFNLCELGPGRGTWMDDILRTISQVASDCVEAAQIVLIEESALLREIQSQRLAHHAQTLEWKSHVTDLPEGPTILIANEFFDAVPIRQYVKTPDAWRERMVALDDADNLTSVLGTGTIEAETLPTHAGKAENGAVYEYAPAREALMQDIAERISKHNGAALIIDYGHAKSGFGDTLQSIQSHAYTDLFHEPGNCDITSHVDFQTLNTAAEVENVKTYSVMTQAQFLLDLGLLKRAGSLGASKSPEIQSAIAADVERLAGNGENGMGDLFKVMCITHGLKDAPVGFQSG